MNPLTLDKADDVNKRDNLTSYLCYTKNVGRDQSLIFKTHDICDFKIFSIFGDTCFYRVRIGVQTVILKVISN